MNRILLNTLILQATLASFEFKEDAKKYKTLCC